MNEKRSVALAIAHPQDPRSVLLVQRPSDDEDLPDVWGLPAASLLAGEDWEDAVRRAGREKLGVDVVAGDLLAEGSRQRAAYRLRMRLYAGTIVNDGRPAAPQDVPGVTQYQAWRWGEAPDLLPAADLGSLCSKLFLRVRGTG